jgi:GT2 family glycosyltransferase
MKLSIIVLNYKTPSDTLECLKSLKKAKPEPGMNVETIVVDNGSFDDSTELIAQGYPEVKLIALDKNLGFAGGNNVGIRLSLSENPDYVMLLNPDTFVAKDFFVKLRQAIMKCDFDIFSPLIYFAPGFEFHRDRYSKSDQGKVVWYGGGHLDWNNIYGSHQEVDEVDRGQLTDCQTTDFATGACLVAKTKVFKQIGMLDEDYFLYLEDLEFCHRARQAGFTVGFNPLVCLWHKVSVSAGGIGSSLNDYFITRNRLLFGIKYAKLRTKIALLREAIGKLVNGSDAQKMAVKDFFFHNLGKGSWLK